MTIVITKNIYLDKRIFRRKKFKKTLFLPKIQCRFEKGDFKEILKYTVYIPSSHL